MNLRSIGDQAENKAIEFVKKLGYKIIDTNFEYYSDGKGRKGEIDIIAIDQDEIVFIEVKSSKNEISKRAVDNIDYKKLNNLERAINYYLLKNDQYDSYFQRIDAIGISQGSIEHILDVFNQD